MNDYFSKAIEKTSWLRFGLSLIALVSYSAWAFRPGNAFSRALEAAGGELPEMAPGFPDGLALRAYEKLGAHVSDYTLFQAIDIPYAIFNFLVFTAIIALGLKRFNLRASPLRFALAFPAIYLIAEFIENPLLVILANGAPAEPQGLIVVQQLATNLKWIGLTPSIVLGLASLAVLLIITSINLVRGKNKSA